MQFVKTKLGGSRANAHLDFWVLGVKKMWMSVSASHAKMEPLVRMAPTASGVNVQQASQGHTVN